MTVIIAVVLLVLGLVIGFVVAWAFGVGASMGLFIGVLLVVAGAVIGFVVEWLIDEAYRRNRELQRQLNQRGSGEAAALGPNLELYQHDDSASQTLADFLRQRDDDVRQLREQIEATEAQMDGLRDEFETYQRTHPDDLTAIKGVGKVYQRKLRDLGFSSFEQLAKADPDRLRRLLDVKNWQRVDIENWIEQARDWMQQRSQ